MKHNMGPKGIPSQGRGIAQCVEPALDPIVDFKHHS